MKISVKIPCFPGFYGGWFDWCELISREVENSETAALYACRDDWGFAPGWRKEIALIYAERYAELIRDELGVRFDVEDVHLWSPREYNFVSDEVVAVVEVGEYSAFAAALLQKVMQPANRKYITAKIETEHKGEHFADWIKAIRDGEHGGGDGGGDSSGELDYMLMYFLECVTFGDDGEYEYITLPVLDAACSHGVFELVATSDELRAEVERVEQYGDMWFGWAEAHDLQKKSRDAFWKSLAQFDEYVHKWSGRVSLNERLKLPALTPGTPRRG